MVDDVLFNFMALHFDVDFLSLMIFLMLLFNFLFLFFMLLLMLFFMFVLMLGLIIFIVLVFLVNGFLEVAFRNVFFVFDFLFLIVGHGVKIYE